ncbi:TetR/AcrR family transcriptional regulator [Nocardia fluminea]|uniref:TetR/AcrR family transcriptional regulator n=1 Tax=Nocardia fluminea TaxID=134984 RepID=UPI003D0DB085
MVMAAIVPESLDSAIAIFAGCDVVATGTAHYDVVVDEAAQTADYVDGRTSRWSHRRPELLVAATEYVLDHGVADLTLRPLAKDIGVTITTVIRQFGSKDQLIETVVRGIHQQLLTDLREDPALAGNDPEIVLQRLWNRWLEPHRAREFGLLFELYALALRAPDNYQWFLATVVKDWLQPIMDALHALGHSGPNVEALATTILALLRGLHLDLAATQDADRVTAAFEITIAALAKDFDLHRLPGA